MFRQIAWVRSATDMCIDDSKTPNDSLIEAYTDWLGSNHEIEGLVGWLDRQAVRGEGEDGRLAYARALEVAASLFADIRTQSPDRLAALCDALTEDLAGGKYDFRQPH
ncbi:hypothetical protein [Dongia sp.]|uniref:hypothetical protein n=1 Tax=Dongia sp. TaxID=1977262 RepID=UPI0037516F96